MDTFLPVLYEAVVNTYHRNDDKVAEAMKVLAADRETAAATLQICALITALRFTQGDANTRYESTSQGELSDAQAKVWMTCLSLLNREHALFVEHVRPDGDPRELVEAALTFAASRTQ